MNRIFWALTFFTALTFLVSCGEDTKASDGYYRYETIHGVPCITNDVSISCDWN